MPIGVRQQLEAVANDWAKRENRTEAQRRKMLACCIRDWRTSRDNIQTWYRRVLGYK